MEPGTDSVYSVTGTGKPKEANGWWLPGAGEKEEGGVTTYGCEVFYGGRDENV